jgi:hypothetical protein
VFSLERYVPVLFRRVVGSLGAKRTKGSNNRDPGEGWLDDAIELTALGGKKR